MTTTTTADIENPNPVDVYCLICNFMAIFCDKPETALKLEELEKRIRQGYDSPQTNSINIFGTNLFIFKYKDYVEMYLKLIKGEI